MDALLSRCVEHRRNLHRIPEVGFKLPKTQGYVYEALKATGGEITEVSPAGVMAYFDFGKEETLALRSDMDALPITERTDLPFASTHPGAMHACGHDAHMGMLLTTAEQMHRLAPSRNVLFIFQPAEESGCGAQTMIDAGALTRYNVGQIFACHVWPSLPFGSIASKPGEFMPMTTELHVTGKGKSSHIALPEEGIDALLNAARFVDRSKRLIEEKYASVRHLYGYGRFMSGTANNILSNATNLDGVIRAFNEDVFDAILTDIQAVSSEIARESGAEFDFVVPRGYPPLINDQNSYERLATLAGSLPFIALDHPWLIAEDFACYLKHVPGAMFQLGIETPTPLHSADFHFDESALLNGIRMFMALIEDRPA